MVRNPDLNKAFLERLKKRSNDEMIATAQSFKMQNRLSDDPITNSKNFQRNYNTVIFELKQRGLFKE